MNFCSKCGKQNEAGVAFCAGCGAPISTGDAANATNAGSTGQQQQAGQQGGGNVFTNTPEFQFDHADVEANKIMALFSYLGLLFLIPLLAAPNSPYARFHTNQGIVLFITEIAASIAAGILFAVLIFIPGVGWALGSLITSAVSIGGLILAILGIVNCVNGKAKELPLIGKFRILK